MADRAQRPCPRCGRISRGGCRICARRRETERPSAADRGYDKEWADYSAGWLRRFPWCGQRQDGRLHHEHSRCVQQARRVRAYVTDHIVPLRAGGARLDPSNHQSLCFGCNVRKGIASDANTRVARSS